MSRTGKPAKATPKIYYERAHGERVALLAGNVPRELREKRIWLLWKGIYKSDKGKWDKIPYYVNGQMRHGQNGSEGDRAALSDFKSTLSALKSDTTYAGLGIALLNDTGVVAVDVDNLNANPDAASLAKELSGITYAETSPSGQGCRAIFTGKARSRKCAPVELFGDSGFVTVTGMDANKKKIEPFGKAPPALGQIFASHDTDKPPQENGGVVKAPSRKLRDVLEDIPNDDLAYDDWLQVVQGIHHSRHGDSTGYKIALEWSQTSEKHEQKKFDTAWHSSGKREEGAPLVTFGTLLHKAGHRKQTERSPAPGRVRPSLQEWNHPKPIPAELWGVYVRKGIVTVVAGPGGSYKSALLLAMVTRRSTSGGEYLGQPVAPGKTLIVLAEDRIEDCVRRIHSIARYLRVPTQALRDSVEFIELTGTDWTGMVELEYGKAVITQTGQHIEQEARACSCDLIIIETANRVTAEETNPVFRRLIAELERIAKVTGVAVVITSHVSKAAGRAGTDDHHAARGGGALTDNARSVLIVSVPEDGTEEAARGLRYLTHAKSTHSEAARQVLLEIEKLPHCGLPMLSDAVPVKEVRRETMRLDIWDRARLLAERTIAKLGCDEVTANQMRQCLKHSGIAFNEVAGALETAVVKGALLETEVTRKGRRFTAYRLSTGAAAGRKAR